LNRAVLSPIEQGHAPGEDCEHDEAATMPRLPQHLFWDVHPEDIDFEKHAAWLVRRVLEYGDWPDWQALVAYYGKSRLAEVVTGIRSLQPRSLAFCKVWFDLPASAFRCSTHPQSL
jgi:hypothetical protein